MIKHTRKHKIFQYLRVSAGMVLCLFLASTAFTQEPQGVEINGDTVEYAIDGDVVSADGNVTIIREGTTLFCDHVEYSRKNGMAFAEGNVRLVTKQGEIRGSRMNFDFNTMKGEFANARIISDPFFGAGRKVNRVSSEHIVMSDAYITTCDHDKPHFRLASPKVDVYPGDKMVARGTRLIIGRVPIMYLPRYTQSLKDGKPRITFTPGYDKEWGAFLLTKIRYYLNNNVKGIIHADIREKKDFGSGIDVNYQVPDMGSGIIRTYYTNERNITSNRFYKERPTPTPERERFKAEWRHKWDIDNNTSAIAQYYRLSDDTFLKDFFEREYEEDPNPETFFLLTRTLPKGTLSFRTDKRVNRFESRVERLPEVRHVLSSVEIGDTNFYIGNTSTFSNLVKKDASPSEVKKETVRFDTDSELSYPMKVGIIEMRPFVGTDQTYYTRTIDRSKYDSIRGTFRTGASLSTKFYRVWDTEYNHWGLEINRLRHIITPTISYLYQNDPTIASSSLDQFDGIDNLSRAHTINFALENKLQTKRNNKTVELLRIIPSVDFRLKEHPNGGGFDQFNLDMDFRPTDWMTLYFDAGYDTREEHLETANFDLYINGKDDKWAFGMGKRFTREVDDIITTEFLYRLNPKWAFRIYDRFDVLNGTQKEQEFTITRDLHEWEMDINFNETRGQGSEIWLIFRLKAFPDASVDLSTSFNKRKAGSQSSE